MDPKQFQVVRQLRLSSLQATGATFQGEATNSNFQVSLKNDLQRLGPIDAYSFDTVGFPNTFPNITDKNNFFLVRTELPAVDGFTTPNAVFSFNNQNGSQSIPVPGQTASTANFVQLFNDAMAGTGEMVDNPTPSLVRFSVQAGTALPTITFATPLEFRVLLFQDNTGQEWPCPVTLLGTYDVKSLASELQTQINVNLPDQGINLARIDVSIFIVDPRRNYLVFQNRPGTNPVGSFRFYGVQDYPDIGVLGFAGRADFSAPFEYQLPLPIEAQPTTFEFIIPPGRYRRQQLVDILQAAIPSQYFVKVTLAESGAINLNFVETAFPPGATESLGAFQIDANQLLGFPNPQSWSLKDGTNGIEGEPLQIDPTPDYTTPRITYEANVGILRLTFPIASNLTSSTWNTIVGIDPQESRIQKASFNGYPTRTNLFNRAPFTVISITPGFYSSDELAAALQTQLDRTFPPLTWSVFQNDDGRFSISPTAISRFSLVQPMFAGVGFNLNVRGLLHTMGFNVFQTEIMGFEPNVASTEPNLFGETIVYLHSQAIAQQVKAYSGQGEPDYMVATLPITVPHGGFQVWNFNQYQSPITRYDKGWSGTVVDMTLKNIYGDTLDIGPNQHMYVTLRLWYGFNAK
jgi:hypothetical protein